MLKLLIYSQGEFQKTAKHRQKSSLPYADVKHIIRMPTLRIIEPPRGQGRTKRPNPRSALFIDFSTELNSVETALKPLLVEFRVRVRQPISLIPPSTNSCLSIKAA